MKSLRCLAAILLFPLCSFGWSAGGHYVAGAVTFYYLESFRPGTIPKIHNILRFHPWFNNPIWTSHLKGLGGEQFDAMLFMLASNFPDDARDSAYGKPPMDLWHTVAYPYVLENQAGARGNNPTSPNAEQVLTDLLQKIGAEPNGAQKAIDLCWIMHLVAEIHQPMHCISLFDDRHPAGDSCGKLTYIYTSPSSSQDLFSFWDNLIESNLTTAPTKALVLMENKNYTDPNLPELVRNLNISQWAREQSFDIAKEKAYLDGEIIGTKQMPSNIPPTYREDALNAANRQIVLAGKRVAAKLAVAL